MNFEQALQSKLDDGVIDRQSAFGRRVSRVLKSSGPRKERALARMESHSRTHLGLSATESVNWGAKTIDWQSIFTLLMKIMPLILALFGL